MLGLEYEYLQLKDEALDCYKRGFSIGRFRLPDDLVIKTLSYKIKELSAVKLPSVRRVFQKHTPKARSTKHISTKRNFGNDVNNTIRISLEDKISMAKFKLNKAKRSLNILMRTKERLTFRNSKLKLIR